MAKQVDNVFVDVTSATVKTQSTNTAQHQKHFPGNRIAEWTFTTGRRYFKVPYVAGETKPAGMDKTAFSTALAADEAKREGVKLG